MGTCFGTRIALHIADDIPDLHGVVFMDPPTGNLDKTWYRAGSVSLGAIAKRLARAPRATLRDPVVRLTLKDKLRGRRSRSDAPEETAVSAAFLEPFEKLVTRRVPVLVCQGPFDVFRKEWVGATRGPLRHVLEHDFVEFHEVPDRAVPPTLTSQEELIDVVTNWMPPTQTHPGSTGRSA
jgi:hypothetical protein